MQAQQIYLKNSVNYIEQIEELENLCYSAESLCGPTEYETLRSILLWKYLKTTHSLFRTEEFNTIQSTIQSNDSCCTESNKQDTAVTDGETTNEYGTLYNENNTKTSNTTSVNFFNLNNTSLTNGESNDYISLQEILFLDPTLLYTQAILQWLERTAFESRSILNSVSDTIDPLHLVWHALRSGQVQLVRIYLFKNKASKKIIKYKKITNRLSNSPIRINNIGWQEFYWENYSTIKINLVMNKYHNFFYGQNNVVNLQKIHYYLQMKGQYMEYQVVKMI